MFLLNSRLGLFSAASSRSKRVSFTILRHPFSLSYGVNLPSSLTRVLSRALGFSPYLPVSVYGTGTNFLVRGFSWQFGIGYFVTYVHSPSPLRFLAKRFCLLCTLRVWTHFSNRALSLPSCVTPSFKRLLVASDFLPIVHRLRLSASA